jgi:hypothetical protein
MTQGGLRSRCGNDTGSEPGDTPFVDTVQGGVGLKITGVIVLFQVSSCLLCAASPL